jgi:exonuclease SbcC
MNKVRKLELKKAHLEGIVFQLGKLIQSERDLKSKLKIAEIEKQKLSIELANLESITRYFEKLESERKNTSTSLSRIREEKGRSQESIKHLKNQLVQIGSAREEIERIAHQIAAQTEAIAVYEILENAFDKDGIPTEILKNLVPEVEEDASRILYDLSDGEMRISFQFGRETKTGTQTDQLVMEAEDDTGHHPVTRFSGGERMRINLALRLGISEVIARRSGYKGKIETLIIDEGLSALDEGGRQATFEILRQLRQRFRKILVISHLDDVKDAFETKLIVSKSATGQSIAEIQ